MPLTHPLRRDRLDFGRHLGPIALRADFPAARLDDGLQREFRIADERMLADHALVDIDRIHRRVNDRLAFGNGDRE